MLKRWIYTLCFKTARWWVVRTLPEYNPDQVLTLGDSVETASSRHTRSPNAAPQPESLEASLEEYLVIEDIINDLAAKQAWLSSYIDSHREDLEPTSLARILALHGQNASRLGRLLRDQHVLSGEVVEGLSEAINLALDELSVRFDTPL
ncbi:MAG: hypothetical protein P1S60_08610 [Anaerolineae bacterium]|nr:hypothetical protein [Anaerolineae bacterium]